MYCKENLELCPPLQGNEAILTRNNEPVAVTAGRAAEQVERP
jgi:hypothetical protein